LVSSYFPDVLAVSKGLTYSQALGTGSLLIAFGRVVSGFDALLGLRQTCVEFSRRRSMLLATNAWATIKAVLSCLLFWIYDKDAFTNRAAILAG